MPKISEYGALTGANIVGTDLFVMVDLSGNVTVKTTVNDLLSALGGLGLVLGSLFNANTILAATSDNTPIALQVDEQRIVGRITGGNIAALSGAQVRALLGLTYTVSIEVTSPDDAALNVLGVQDGLGPYYRVPASIHGLNLTAVAAALDVTSSSGIPTIQLRRKRSGSDVDMLSTKLTIDAGETDSSSAAAAAVINTSNDDVATGDRIYFDLDVAGTGAKGLLVELTFA